VCQGELNGNSLATDAGETAITATTNSMHEFRLLAGDMLEFVGWAKYQDSD